MSTVSMVFTDIEGSTVLLRRLGDSYLEALEGHRRILRAVWREYDGVEQGTEGDSFFVVFPTATGAVGAAVEGQRRLAGHAWPGGERLRVRMGIHTGTPGLSDGDYWGMDVHRAARVAASAHGGQVIASATTGELVRQVLPDGAVLRDLGTHHLKDIPEPERLFQITVLGLDEEFPPPRTLGTATSLPVPATALLGRDADLARLGELIREADVRLVSLVGPGGAGKTRLAIAVAAGAINQFPGGAYFVPLADAVSEEVMWSAIAEGLDVPPRERTPARLTAYLAQRTLMLVLDNLEQVDGADRVVAQILDRAPQVKVVATSRRPLGLVAERQHLVTPLDTRSAAVELFVQRATAVQADFDPDLAVVREICERLDGLPLAIELCAPRIRVLSLEELLDRIDHPLDFASTSRVTPDRQRTLRDTIAWSYDLLNPEHQRIFRRLAVFSGGADLAAITAIAADTVDPLDAVAELHDANLITVTQGTPTRIAFLQTISQYAGEKLAATDEAEALRAAHAAHYAELGDSLRHLRESRHGIALERVETELGNFRAALSWAITTDLAQGTRLCAALSWIWVLTGDVAEGRRWHEEVFARAGADRSADLAACLRGLANLLLVQGESQRALAEARRALALSESLEDRSGIAWAMSLVGTAQLHQGELDAAQQTLTEGLELHRQLDDDGRLARILGNLAGVEEELGHHDRAEALLRESLAVLNKVGDAHETAVQGQNLAYLLALTGRVEEADSLARGLIPTVLSLGSPSLTMAFSNTMMTILARQGSAVLAARLFGAEEAMGERLAIPNPYLAEELREALVLVAGVLSTEDWQAYRRYGRSERVEDLLARLPNAAAGALESYDLGRPGG
ncbi:ATP-binding protein [Kribbella italica]|uniref:Putative ATPase/class 3 adenylate cyclase n=1 Tax=Kribbella italica TaxID=1540520 RepID=A0A7W9JGL2_9ACTN|nr:tetratricopeptide repeat protein [Kribbella italica]MBB5841539.1 putative ATPase/class 3 adenylate cyclase [Kribbella italica]